MRHLRTRCATLGISCLAIMLATAPVSGAGLTDEFTISLEQAVSNGVPGPGAGNIEASGAMDRYFLTVDANTLVFIDELSAANCSLLWRLLAPDSSVIFNNNALCVGDPGVMTLAAAGTYTFEAYSNNNSTGTYSFIIWAVNPPENFAIGFEQPVSNGVPGPGAGNIEEPGSIDRYTFTATAGTHVYFDELSASNCSLAWTCRAPDNSTVFASNPICVADPGEVILPLNGVYTLEAVGNAGSTGTYSFTIWTVEPPDEFDIVLKQIVSNGVPGPGAGNIEEPGAVDRYTLAVDAGTLVYFDELSASNCSLQWRCLAPDASVVFDTQALCVTDPGEILLEQSGEHTIEAFAPNGFTGTYSFVVLEVNTVQTFPITLEQTVSNGVPAAGAGNIEEPGAIDEYTFSVTPGTLVFFDELAAANCSLQWRCTAPDGSEVFANNPLCVTDPAQHVLTQPGTYRLRASSPGGATGTYSFIIWQVNPPQDFVIAIDQIVSNGTPGPGAGNIEEPGSIDRYTLTLATPTSVCFEELGGPCALQWTCTGPGASTVFGNQTICVTNPGKFLLQAGAYVISVSGQGDAIGTYSIIANLGRPADITGDCRVNIDDLLAVIAAWGVCPNPQNCPADVVPSGIVDIDDLLAVISDWG